MKRLATVLAVLLAGAVLVAPAARAGVDRVTITGPAVAPYYSTVTLSGHTPHAGDMVTIHIKRPTSSSYTALTPIRSNAHAAYSRALIVKRDYLYYATAAGGATPVHTIAFARASCTSSGPAFTTTPVPGGTDPAKPYASTFTAVRGSTWAGVAVNYRLGVFNVIRWRPGTAPKVLGTFTYNSFLLGGRSASVSVVGITPSGAVVAHVQAYDRDPDRQRAFVWTADGRRHELRTPSMYFSLLGVIDTGAIIGRIWTSTSSDIVAWTNPDANYRVLVHLGRTPYPYFGAAAVDSRGDIAYEVGNAAAVHVRLPGGEVRNLVRPSGSGDALYPTLGAGDDIYTGENHAVLLRWTPSAAPPTGPIVARAVAAGDVWTQHANRERDVLYGLNTYELVTRAGSVARVPDAGSGVSAPTVDYRGVVSYTASDHLIHFLTCH